MSDKKPRERWVSCGRVFDDRPDDEEAYKVREVIESSPSQDEFDEKAAREAWRADTTKHYPNTEEEWVAACRWQFNQMKRAPIVNEESEFIMAEFNNYGGDTERDRLAEEICDEKACWAKDNIGNNDNAEFIFKLGWNARPVRSVKDASAEELMGNEKVAALVEALAKVEAYAETGLIENYSDSTEPQKMLGDYVDEALAAFKGEK